MIIQRLTELYRRLSSQPDVAQVGYSSVRIAYALVLNSAGKLVGVEDLRQTSKNGKKFCSFFNVPQKANKSSNITADFLWGPSGYVLGFQEGDDRCDEKFKAFKEKAQAIGGSLKDSGMKAVLSFLEKWSPTSKGFKDLDGQSLVFKLKGDTCFVHDRPAVKEQWLSQPSPGKLTARCMISGTVQPIAMLHSKIQGVPDTQGAGAQLVSFNQKPFQFYCKHQGENAPISESVSFAYTTALSYLLRHPTMKRVIGNAVYLCWSDKPTSMESTMFNFVDGNTVFDYSADGVPKKKKNSVKPEQGKVVIKSLSDLAPPKKDLGTRFFVLGLSGNNSRIAVRFFKDSNVSDLYENLRMFREELKIEKQFKEENDLPSLWLLLNESVSRATGEKVPDRHFTMTFESILKGLPYPSEFLPKILVRARVEKKINYRKASMLKAILIRNFKKEIPMILDENKTDTGYLIGRLFAVYEKIQMSQGEVKKSLRERFFSAMSSNPGCVIIAVRNLSDYYFSKLSKGGQIYFEKMIGGIMGKINKIPGIFTLEEQAEFMLGYYHQRNALYRGKEEVADSKEE